MANPNTTPTVITDRNGKTTTVHKKNSVTVSSRAAIPAVSLAPQSREEELVQQEITDIQSKLLIRSNSFGVRHRFSLYSLTQHAVDEGDIILLRLMDKHITDGRQASHLKEAVTLLDEYGENPEEYLTEQHVDAVFLIQGALEKWETWHDNYKGGGIDRRSEGREALILYVLEEPSRVTFVDEALRRGAKGINDVMEYEKSAKEVHQSVVQGIL